MALNERRQRFVDAKVGGSNASEAARAAGYGSPGMAGSRLMKNDEVRQAVDSAVESVHEQAEATLVWILSRLAHEAVNAHEGSVRVAALAWLGKHRGMFTEQVDVRVNVLGAYAELTTAELRLLASGESSESP